MFQRFRERSRELEHLDLGDYTETEYEGCLVELRRINRFFGDASALRKSLFPEIERANLKEFSALDVGAGSGELLRVIARWARDGKRTAHLTALELNNRSAQAVIEESRSFPEITAVRADALRLPFATDSFDYVICSLFTHHLAEEEIVTSLGEVRRVARRRIFIIDLHRHPLAYYFYTTVGQIFLHNRLTREDGALSILRGFKPEELNALAAKAELAEARVERRFPFRLVLSGSGAGSKK